MFDIGFGEIAVIAVIALFIFGPDRLPKLIRDATSTIRTLRQMATDARREITDSIEPELKGIDVAGLNPKEFVRRTLFEDDPDLANAERDQARRNANGSAAPSGPATPKPTNGSTPAPWDADAT